MNHVQYSNLKIDSEQAEAIAFEFYGIKGSATSLAGELDFNFKLQTPDSAFLLKVSRPDFDEVDINFQRDLLDYLQTKSPQENYPRFIENKSGETTGIFTDEEGNERNVRLLTWAEGRLFSSVSPHREELLFGLGKKAGQITSDLQGFDHPFATRNFEWDILQAQWTQNHIDLFTEEQRHIAEYFYQEYAESRPELEKLRKSVVHNDVNDNNIVVSRNLKNPEISSIIDFGDAIRTASICDLAITIAYAVMNKPDPLRAAIPIVKGYHSSFPLEDQELKYLYLLVAIRLIISVTKSAINKELEPDNEYLLVSEQPAWDLLSKWRKVNEQFAYFSFRDACGYTAHPQEDAFVSWLQKNERSLNDLFPTLNITHAVPVDMSVSSTWLGTRSEYQNDDLMSFKLSRLQAKNPGGVIMDGYLEVRPLYTSSIFKHESNEGPEYRSMHLGVDFWIDAQTPIHALFDGEVYSIHDNKGDKNYGPTLILRHELEGLTFFSLYGHLSTSTLDLMSKGQQVKQGELIAYLGEYHENGNWTPHLHFQLMLDMLGNKVDFNGVGTVREKDIWQSLCPNPHLLFKETRQEIKPAVSQDELIDYRRNHLGKGLSLSYQKPLHIVRGEGAYLIDHTGRKYLDTVNNVAHVGHEHPRVVKAGQQQIATLNTNTRYLHSSIRTFADTLLATFPEQLCVVHFVNSGSEANELAIRMAKTHTGQKDFIAIEIGYHGNTNATVDVSSYKFDGKGGSGAPDHTHIVPIPDTYRGKYQGHDAGASYVSHVQECIERIHSQDRKPAGLIAESILSCGGQIELPEGYLKQAYELVRKAGGVCIADEVQTGIGRVGSHNWAFELHDVIPDIVTIGKPLGNGHPVAAVVCTREIADSFANGMEYFNTFGGNPVSCAIGTEVLNVIKEEGLKENAATTGAYLKTKLTELQNKYPIIGDVRGQGLFLGFELVDTNKKPLPEHAAYLANRMKDYAILMSTDGPDHNVLKIKPPMVFCEEHANELIYRLGMVFDENFMQAY